MQRHGRPSRPSGRTSTEGGDEEDEERKNRRSPKTPTPSRISYAEYADDDEEEEEEEEDADLIEVMIETLTGTVFRVRVSRWESVAGLKALLYNAGGIPSSQQHLLLGQKELVDDMCLLEQNVQDGATLRLVLALRGGPVNAPRTSTYEDVVWQEVTDYMEMNRDELWENLPGGKSVTLLVLRDGESVNLYRVTENEDGSFTPLNESWGSGSSHKTEDIAVAQLEENRRMQARFAQLKASMDKEKNKRKAAELKNASKKSVPAREIRPSLDNSLARRQRASARKDPQRIAVDRPKGSSKSSVQQKSNRQLPRVPTRRHPTLPVTRGSRPTTQERSIELRRNNVSRSSLLLDDIVHSQPPRYIDFTGRRPLEGIRGQQSIERPSLGSVEEDGNNFHSPEVKSDTHKHYDAYRKSLVKHEKLSEWPSSSIETLDDVREILDTLPRREGPRPFFMRPPRRQKIHSDTDPLHSSHNCDILRLPRDTENRPKTSPEVLERRPGTTSDQSTVSERVQLRAPDDRLKELVTILNTSRGNSRQSNHSSENAPDHGINSLAGTLGNLGVSSHHKKEGKSPLSVSLASPGSRSSHPSLPPTPGTGALTAHGTREQRDILREFIRAQGIGAGPPQRPAVSEQIKKVVRRPGSGRSKVPPSPARLPVVNTPNRKKRGGHRPRCEQCKRRLGLSNIYHCRCERVFCAQHRYAETHSCTFDYKSEGRKILQVANPLVTPHKLPKI